MWCWFGKFLQYQRRLTNSSKLHTKLYRKHIVIYLLMRDLKCFFGILANIWTERFGAERAFQDQSSITSKYWAFRSTHYQQIIRKYGTDLWTYPCELSANNSSAFCHMTGIIYGTHQKILYVVVLKNYCSCNDYDYWKISEQSKDVEMVKMLFSRWSFVSITWALSKHYWEK